MARIKHPSSGDDDDGYGREGDDFPWWEEWMSWDGWTGWEAAHSAREGEGVGGGGSGGVDPAHQISGELVSPTGALWLRDMWRHGGAATDETPTQPTLPVSFWRGTDSLPPLPLPLPDDESATAQPPPPPAPPPPYPRTTAPITGTAAAEDGRGADARRWRVPLGYPTRPDLPAVSAVSGVSAGPTASQPLPVPAMTEPSGPLWEQMGPRARQAWWLGPRAPAWQRRVLAREQRMAVVGPRVNGELPTTTATAHAPMPLPSAGPAPMPTPRPLSLYAGDRQHVQERGQTTATLVRDRRASAQPVQPDRPPRHAAAVRGEGEPWAMSAGLAAPAPGMPPSASVARPVRLAPFFQIARPLPTVQSRERVGQFVWDLSLRHEPHVLVAAFLSSFRREQFLMPSIELLPESISPQYLAKAMMYPSYASRWSLDESIERSPLFRFVGAACWIRLVAETELAAAAAGMDTTQRGAHYLYDVPARAVGPDFAATFSPLAVMASVYWAPSPLDAHRAPYSQRQHGPAWTAWRARYYTYLLRLIAALLLPHSMIDAQTMEYLDGEQVPAPPGPARYNQIGTYGGATRFALRSPEAAEAADNAWEDYLDWLAARNVVPRLLVDWRLNLAPWDAVRRDKPYRGAWEVETLEQWQWCVDALCQDCHELATWRKRAARHWGVRDERDLTLYLMDPLVGPTEGKGHS